MSGPLFRLLRGQPLPAVQPTAAYLVALRADPCSYCGATCERLDHIQPKLRDYGGTVRPRVDRRSSGSDGWDNLTSACQRCNASKGAKSLLGHLGYRRWCASERKRLLDELAAESANWRGIGK